MDEFDWLPIVSKGELTIEGRLMTASNATFYCDLALDGLQAAAVYKPVRGERPLWDFPNGSLAQREAATYLMSVATGWDLIPPTVLRDGPLGPGMVQLWIEPSDADDARAVDVVPRGSVPAGWMRVFDAYDGEGDEVSLIHADLPELRRLAVLDVVVNNADRKGGHVLVAQDGSIFGVDHGLSFHVEEKLRTVLWGWAGKPLLPEELDVLAKLEKDLDGPLGTGLSELVDADEIAVLRSRIAGLRAVASFPGPGDGWPAIPWPVF